MKDALEFLLVGDNDEAGIATKKDVNEYIERRKRNIFP